MGYKGVITRVIPGSIAEEIELQPGDTLLSVNGQEVKDIIELSFALADEYLELLIEKADGQQEIIELDKEYDEELGLEFESAVFDGVRRCANRCVFCFVDQMPAGMRESLYVKDDDYRLSFLYGNFVTMTNVVKADMDRIKNLHLSPLYISVHATDAVVRQQLLGRRQGGAIMEQIHELLEAGIELHTQVVLCPGLNDGEILEKTIRELAALRPQVLSLAIVPVGLSKFRDDCYPLTLFTPEKAAAVLDRIHAWQETCRQEDGQAFVYAADEFYVAAGRQIPPYEAYDEFPQLENGVGLVRSFIRDWEDAVAAHAARAYAQTQYIDIVCGVSAEKILRPLLADLAIAGLSVRLVPVDNQFFGTSITVTGLLTGGDMLRVLQQLEGPRNGVIIPGVALRKGEQIFLDNTYPADIEKALGVPVQIAHNAEQLYELLANWEEK